MAIQSVIHQYLSIRNFIFDLIMKLFGNICQGHIIRLTEEQCNLLKEVLTEGYYDDSATPLFSKTRMQRELGRNPLAVDNGGHTPSDVLRQPSTYDSNGANFKGTNIIVSDNKFMFYKLKNFSSDKISGTLQFFGKGSIGEKGLRAAIDTINGAAKRNGRNVLYRHITSDSNKEKSKASGFMLNTFWEFSLDGGASWNILKPNPIDKIQKSKVTIKM